MVEDEGCYLDICQGGIYKSPILVVDLGIVKLALQALGGGGVHGHGLVTGQEEEEEKIMTEEWPHEVIHLGLAREDGTKHGERPAFLSPWSNLADLVDSAIGSERARECVNLIIRSLFWKIIWRGAIAFTVPDIISPSYFLLLKGS